MDLDVKLKDGYYFQIDNDTDPMDPRDYDFQDQWCKMVCFHTKYSLGDKHDYDKNDYDSWSELADEIENRENPICMLPVYIYDHSGIRISTEPFGCKWDSGQVGFIYATTKTIDGMGMSPDKNEDWNDFQDRLIERLKADIRIYDLYVSGQVYCLQIFDKDDEVEESISGFFGSNWSDNGVMDYIKPYMEEAETVGDL